MRVLIRPLAVAVLAGVLAVTAIATHGFAAPQKPTFGPMIDDYGSYEGQRKCDPEAKPGVLAFQQLVLEAYPGTGAGGIGRDCNVGGQSEHKEGRAWDWGVNAGVPEQKAAADELIDWLLAEDSFGNKHAMARRVGIMYIIWNRRIWGNWGGWSTYCKQKATGCYAPGTKDLRHPHTDHVHFSFTWAGARKQTSFWNADRSLVSGIAAHPAGLGYWLAGRNGGISAVNVGDFGSKAGEYPSHAVMDIAPTWTGSGYWILTASGKIYAFGDARHKGSIEGSIRAAGVAANATGKGYWIVSKSGRVYAFGDANNRGGARKESALIVDMSATPTGQGYWLYAEDGRVFAFGDAVDAGRAENLDAPVVAGDNSAGDGYWVVTGPGRVVALGGAPALGGVADKDLGAPIVGLSSTPSGRGYWLVTSKGRVFPFGDARGIAL